jgi:addiction module RelE/StbE family toxin
MTVRWLVRAKRDLEQVVDGISQANPIAAMDVHRRILASVGRLDEFPNVGRIGIVHGTRELVIGDYPYVVIYRVIASDVQILGVRHTSRQWPV